jgi:hypothetical protein
MVESLRGLGKFQKKHTKITSHHGDTEARRKPGLKPEYFRVNQKDFAFGFLRVSVVDRVLRAYFPEQAQPLQAAGFGASVFGQ